MTSIILQHQTEQNDNEDLNNFNFGLLALNESLKDANGLFHI